MDEHEARSLLDVPKWGEPEAEWRQDRPNTMTNSFGVVDNLGQSIPGLVAEFSVFRSPKLGIGKYVFTLKKTQFRKWERVYQLEITHQKGLSPRDHGYSHEHFGETRNIADPSWADCSYAEAVDRFMRICSLKLTGELPDPEGIKLK